jgi:hypothetical protein
MASATGPMSLILLPATEWVTRLLPIDHLLAKEAGHSSQ